MKGEGGTVLQWLPHLNWPLPFLQHLFYKTRQSNDCWFCGYLGGGIVQKGEDLRKAKLQ